MKNRKKENAKEKQKEEIFLWEGGKYSNECRKVRISEKVKSIDPIGNDGPFENCSHITHIFIPNTVTSIGYYAFFKCSSLTNINIPNSVNSIGVCVFDECPKLSVITIPKRFKDRYGNNEKFKYY